MDLSRPWAEYPILVLDTETTGIGEGHAIVEIAAVRLESGVIVEEWSALIDPGRDIPAEATAVHGITNEMVKGQLTIEDVAGELMRLGQGAVPCAYNAPFDKEFLHRSLSGTDCPAFDPAMSWIDVYVIIASPRVDKFVKGPGRLKLANVCKRHGIELTAAHRALGDARATAQLLCSLVDRGLVKPVSLGRLLEHTDRMREQHNQDFQAWRARQPA